MTAEELARKRQGFSGAVAGLTLSDVIQLKGYNRFSGCLTVENGELTGKIYFREGEIIHAEQGGQAGKDAFHQIFLWKNGKFQTYPNVSTTNHTISDGWNFLLMEAHQLLDEGKLQVSAAKAETPDMAAEAKMASDSEKSPIAAQLKGIPGVMETVFHNRDGVPLEEASFTEETLAAHSAYLSSFANRLGAIFGVGTVRSASIEGESAHLLMFESKGNYLSIAINAEQPVGAVEGEIRKVFAGKKQVQP